MLRLMTTAMVVTLLFASAASAQKMAKRPVGIWVRDLGGDKVTFVFKENSLKCTINFGDLTMVIEADHGVSVKDKVLFGRVSKLDDPSGNGPPPGTLFSFRYNLTKDTLEISNLTPESPEARQLLEGKYKRKEM